LPDWRSPSCGLYSRIAERARREGDADLAECPGLVFALSHFRRDPTLFYRAVREHCLWPGTAAAVAEASAADDDDDDQNEAGDQEDDDAKSNTKRKKPKHKNLRLPPQLYKPTAAHFLLASLEKRGLLLRAYSQNVDGLEFEAGCSEGKIVQAHGGFREAHCAACGRAASPYAVMQALASDGEGGAEEEEEEEVPRCDACGERAVKPAVVLFGERLPARFHRLRLSDLPQCELLLVLGTALAVEPFASLLNAVPTTCPRVLVNRCEVRQCEEEGEGGGFVFAKQGPCRDVAVLGECDDGCLALAEALGGAAMREEVERGWRGKGGGGGGVAAAAPA
jgi:NAD-dependent SIR2 family protein deacetylase